MQKLLLPKDNTGMATFSFRLKKYKIAWDRVPRTDTPTCVNLLRRCSGQGDAQCIGVDALDKPTAVNSVLGRAPEPVRRMHPPLGMTTQQGVKLV